MEEKVEQVEERLCDVMARIFEFWKVRMGYPRARLDEKRRVKLRLRLCDGYTEQDLLDAIEGCACSAFHMGSNDRGRAYNDIELICRDAAHVDQFLGFLDQHKAQKARAAALAKAKRDEEERLERERRERLGRPRIHGLRSV